MKKSFKQLCDQLERIYRLYEWGAGSRRMIERAEMFMHKKANVGLMF